MIDLARTGNKYLTENEPWKTFKTDPDNARDVLQNSLHIIGHLGVLMQPFLPLAAKRIFKMLNFPQTTVFYDEPLIFADGHDLSKSELLFEKVEDSVIEAQVEKLKVNSAVSDAEMEIEVQGAKPNINYDQFSALDIRVGTILEAEKVAKTKKLLKLRIDTGLDVRTVVSGIAEYFEPENIIGKQVSILVNLEPREIKGILSQGMILMAENSEGKLSFVATPETFTNGSIIR